MRTNGRVMIVALLFVLTGTARADAWGEIRRRPGNDDVFIMIDTSRSMGADSGGSLAAVKVFAQDFYARYLKAGDRVLLMTFDSDARVHGVVSIGDRRRDVELLREVTEAVDVRRVIRYRGTWPDLTETANGPWRGGSAVADYCEMWRTVSRVLQTYGDSSRRQLLLLFSGGGVSGPGYRQCAEPRPSAAILAALRERRLRMAVVATAGIGTPHLRAFAADESLKFIDLRGDRAEGLDELLELLNGRVDLVSPASIQIVPSPTGDLRVPVTVLNRASRARSITIRSAALHLRNADAPLELSVTPSTITLGPHKSGVLMLSRPNVFQESGDYQGEVVFHFAAGTRFDPPALPFSAHRQPWLVERRRAIMWSAGSMVVGVGVAVAWIALHKSRQSEVSAWPPSRFRRGPQS